MTENHKKIINLIKKCKETCSAIQEKAIANLTEHPNDLTKPSYYYDEGKLLSTSISIYESGYSSILAMAYASSAIKTLDSMRRLVVELSKSTEKPLEKTASALEGALSHMKKTLSAVSRPDVRDRYLSDNHHYRNKRVISGHHHLMGLRYTKALERHQKALSRTAKGLRRL